ncbi:Hypothetical protein SCLAV_p0486 (plasmid) [Streptomyces clavuligerus]|uniref:Uncharacterized protein n=1 Tax=Streptomyces clavuligerus TaxID=1901 RepID=B5GRC2_STRCL|nr:hypothetical protein SSCG_01896 [Streptomyces clavuligerus]EFG03976.1 Hypothetical protein SCLAV_p0486 [Streptomyces clavuligerus]
MFPRLLCGWTSGRSWGEQPVGAGPREEARPQQPLEPADERRGLPVGLLGEGVYRVGAFPGAVCQALAQGFGGPGGEQQGVFARGLLQRRAGTEDRPSAAVPQVVAGWTGREPALPQWAGSRRWSGCGS